MLAFIIALLIVVIIGSIVYGIYKLIVGIIKLCRKSSTDQSKRTYEEREKIFSIADERIKIHSMRIIGIDSGMKMMKMYLMTSMIIQQMTYLMTYLKTLKGFLR